MLKTSPSRVHERGAVSLFIVIFCALLMTVLTISFIRLMVQEQQQAATNDLSQSAYDSAQAGIEDAKRALLLCQRGDTSACDTLDTKSCESVPAALGTAMPTNDQGNKEMIIQTGVGDESLNQAYTCVKVTRKTPDYTASLKSGTSKIIPLKGVKEFDTIELSWFAYEDFASTGSSRDTDLLFTGTDIKLPPASINAWPKNRPSLLRTQLMQFDKNGFTLDSFNKNAADKSNANTLFLYPSKTVSPASRNFVDDTRQDKDGARLNVVQCEPNLDVLEYACKIQLRLPEPVNGSGNLMDRTAYLRLSALYNDTSYSVKLLKGTEVVEFDNVLPKVDSTGRANDIFRRVESRLEMNPINFPYPENAVDVTGNLCKSFVVTDGTGTNQGYRAGSCTQ